MAKKINRSVFTSYIRRAPFGNRLSQAQLDGTNDVLDYWEANHQYEDHRWLAYILATNFHETGGYMLPIKETVYPSHKNKNPSDKEVIRRLDNAFKTGKLKSVKTPYWRDGYFGRGRVQITHKSNYQKFGIDNDVDRALDRDFSTEIMVKGMINGSFSSGNTLKKYFNENKEDPVGARWIVNGTDKAALIAKYYENFKDAIEASFKKEKEETVKEEETTSDETPWHKDPQTIAVTGGSVASGIIGAISSPWGVLSLVIIIATIAGYLYYRHKEKRDYGV